MSFRMFSVAKGKVGLAMVREAVVSDPRRGARQLQKPSQPTVLGYPTPVCGFTTAYESVYSSKSPIKILEFQLLISWVGPHMAEIGTEEYYPNVPIKTGVPKSHPMEIALYAGRYEGYTRILVDDHVPALSRALYAVLVPV